MHRQREREERMNKHPLKGVYVRERQRERYHDKVMTGRNLNSKPDLRMRLREWRESRTHAQTHTHTHPHTHVHTHTRRKRLRADSDPKRPTYRQAFGAIYNLHRCSCVCVWVYVCVHVLVRAHAQTRECQQLSNGIRINLLIDPGNTNTKRRERES